jgi:hypothetical protein
MKPSLIALLFLVCGACGDDDSNPPRVDGPAGPVVDAPLGAVVDATPTPTFDAPAVTPGCSVTLAGAATGTYACLVTAGKNNEEIFSVFGLSAGSGTLTALVLVARVDGTVAAGNNVTMATASASVTIGLDSFIANLGSDTDIGTIGPLDITSLTTLPGEPGTVVWAVHGSVKASLVSLLNPDAKVTLTATF